MFWYKNLNDNRETIREVHFIFLTEITLNPVFIVYFHIFFKIAQPAYNTYYVVAFTINHMSYIIILIRTY